jgi:hypothetical protein
VAAFVVLCGCAASRVTPFGPGALDVNAGSGPFRGPLSRRWAAGVFSRIESYSILSLLDECHA